jgi:hypothetical protein
LSGNYGLVRHLLGADRTLPALRLWGSASGESRGLGRRLMWHLERLHSRWCRLGGPVELGLPGKSSTEGLSGLLGLLRLTLLLPHVLGQLLTVKRVLMGPPLCDSWVLRPKETALTF